MKAADRLRAERRKGHEYTSLLGPGVESVGSTYGPQQEENARRLAACWNACAGLPTEALEARALDGTVGRLVIENAELLAACETMLLDVARYLEGGGRLTATEAAHVEGMRAAVAAAKGG